MDKKMIAIIDYNMGNVGSIKNMLSRIGVQSLITSQPDELISCQGIILPGVGTFDKAMENLLATDLVPLLIKVVMNDKKPILGICLGMQIMAKNSEEGKLSGLGWIDAEVKKFNFGVNKSDLRIPHMCWNEITPKKSSRLLLHNYKNSRYYFVHSYYMEANKKENILATTNYGVEFVSAVEKNNLYGVQFHPEKSHKYGMKILENFSNIL